MEYTVMTAADYDDAYALWAATPGMRLSAADEREAMGRYLAKNEGQSFVCRADGRLVGTILCGNEGRRALVHHLAVDPAYRGQGIGTQLVRLAADTQRALGIERMFLFVLKDNPDGLAFWQRAGFAVKTEIDTMAMDL